MYHGTLSGRSLNTLITRNDKPRFSGGDSAIASAQIQRFIRSPEALVRDGEANTVAGQSRVHADHRSETEEVTCAVSDRMCQSAACLAHAYTLCLDCDSFLSSCLDRRHGVVITVTCQIRMATLAIINETTINKCAKQEVVNAHMLIADIQLNIVLAIDWPIWRIFIHRYLYGADNQDKNGKAS